jgi:hypothetical protein
VCAYPLRSPRTLTNRSAGIASMPKIVTDVRVTPVASRAPGARGPKRRGPKRRGPNVEAALSAASARELAFRLLYIRRPGAGIRRLLTPVLKVGGLFEKARSDIRIRACHRKLQQCRRLIRQIFFTLHNIGSPLLPVSVSRCRCDYARQWNPFLWQVYKSELKHAVSREPRCQLAAQFSPRSLPVSL